MQVGFSFNDVKLSPGTVGSHASEIIDLRGPLQPPLGSPCDTVYTTPAHGFVLSRMDHAAELVTPKLYAPPF